MGRGTELPDAEAIALCGELRRLVDEKESEQRQASKRLGGKRAIGLALGFPNHNASQVVGAALESGRVGKKIADGLYPLLGVTREEFLLSKGLAVGASFAERVLGIAARLDLSAIDALHVHQDLAKDFADGRLVEDAEIERRLNLTRIARTSVDGDGLEGDSDDSPRRPVLVRTPARRAPGVER